MTALNDVVDAQSDPIASAQLAVDREVEEREFAGSMVELQSNANGPDLFQLQRGLLAEQSPLVPRRCVPAGASDRRF